MALNKNVKRPKILFVGTLAGGYAGADSTGQVLSEYLANTYVFPAMCPVMFQPELFCVLSNAVSTALS